MCRHYDRKPKTVQNVGLQCTRFSANSAEDNAMYKEYSQSLVHRPGAGDCANLLMCEPLLCPRMPDLDEYLRLLQTNQYAKCVTLRFRLGWRARCSEIEVLADRAAAKHSAAMRNGVIHDTTTSKGICIPRSRMSTAGEHWFDARLNQVLLLQLACRNHLHSPHAQSALLPC